MFGFPADPGPPKINKQRKGIFASKSVYGRILSLFQSQKTSGTGSYKTNTQLRGGNYVSIH